MTYWLRTCCKAFIISKYLLRISLWSLFKRSMYSFLRLTIVLGWRQTSIMPHLFINWIKIYACITLKQVRVSIRFRYKDKDRQRNRGVGTSICNEFLLLYQMFSKLMGRWLAFYSTFILRKHSGWSLNK